MYASEWTFTEDPSEELEARIHQAGYRVYWHGDGRVTMDVDVRLPDPHLNMLAELAPISRTGSWVMWWTDENLASGTVSVSVVGDAELHTVVVSRTPDLMRRVDAAVTGEGQFADLTGGERTVAHALVDAHIAARARSERFGNHPT